MSEHVEAVSSPCIGVCAMNELTGYCHGCYRTIEEIRAWWDMADADKRKVMDILEIRQTEDTSFD